MSEYPRLTEMGIKNPREIEKFAVYTVEHTDILQITYDRKKGSLLPVSRRYKFPQQKKSIMVDSGTRKTQVVYESVGAFREALHELEQLKIKRAEGKELKTMIKEEIRLLDEDISLRLQYIRKLLEKL